MANPFKRVAYGYTLDCAGAYAWLVCHEGKLVETFDTREEAIAFIVECVAARVRLELEEG